MHALREADAVHARVALGKLQSGDETPEVGAVDLVVAGQQHGAHADDLEVRVEPGLQLALELAPRPRANSERALTSTAVAVVDDTYQLAATVNPHVMANSP